MIKLRRRRHNRQVALEWQPLAPAAARPQGRHRAHDQQLLSFGRALRARNPPRARAGPRAAAGVDVLPRTSDRQLRTAARAEETPECHERVSRPRHVKCRPEARLSVCPPWLPARRRATRSWRRWPPSPRPSGPRWIRAPPPPRRRPARRTRSSRAPPAPAAALSRRWAGLLARRPHLTSPHRSAFLRRCPRPPSHADAPAGAQPCHPAAGPAGGAAVPAAAHQPRRLRAAAGRQARQGLHAAARGAARAGAAALARLCQPRAAGGARRPSRCLLPAAACCLLLPPACCCLLPAAACCLPARCCCC